MMLSWSYSVLYAAGRLSYSPCCSDLYPEVGLVVISDLLPGGWHVLKAAKLLG